jgi:lysine-specific demethylase 8
VAALDRIVAPAVPVFERDHLRPCAPVILTRLFAGQPITRLDSIAALEARFGEVPVAVSREYFAYRRAGRALPPKRICALADYLARVRADPACGLVVSESLVPRALLALVRVPRYCAFEYRADVAVHSQLFLAVRGSFAHLHFDGDHAHVLLHQVIGRKRVVLLPVDAARHLAPILNFSGLELEKMTAREQAKLIARTGGYEAILEPGETLYVPPLFWHYFEYVDTALTINFRFGRSARRRFLARIHPSVHLQGVADRLGRERPLDGDELRAYRRLRAEARRPFRSLLRRRRHLQEVLEELYRTLYPDAPLPTLSAKERRLLIGIGRPARK